MRRDAGLTLLEVIIATLILAVGVIGAAALQSTGLQASRTASIIQQLDADARSVSDRIRLPQPPRHYHVRIGQRLEPI